MPHTCVAHTTATSATGTKLIGDYAPGTCCRTLDEPVKLPCGMTLVHVRVTVGKTTRQGWVKMDHIEIMEEEMEYIPEKIIQSRLQKATKAQKAKGAKDTTLYLVKWVGWPEAQNTWEPAANLAGTSAFAAYKGFCGGGGFQGIADETDGSDESDGERDSEAADSSDEE